MISRDLQVVLAGYQQPWRSSQTLDNSKPLRTQEKELFRPQIYISSFTIICTNKLHSINDTSDEDTIKFSLSDEGHSLEMLNLSFINTIMSSRLLFILSYQGHIVRGYDKRWRT